MFTPFVATLAAAALGAVPPSFGSEPAVPGFQDAAGSTPAPTYYAVDQGQYLTPEWIEPASAAAPTRAAADLAFDQTSFLTPDRVDPATRPAVGSELAGGRRAAAEPITAGDEYAWRGARGAGVVRLGVSAAPSDEYALRDVGGSVVEVARLDDASARADEYAPSEQPPRAVVAARMPTSTDEARAAAGAAHSGGAAPAMHRVATSTDEARGSSQPAPSALPAGHAHARAGQTPCACDARG